MCFTFLFDEEVAGWLVAFSMYFLVTAAEQLFLERNAAVSSTHYSVFQLFAAGPPKEPSMVSHPPIYSYHSVLNQTQGGIP